MLPRRFGWLTADLLEGIAAHVEPLLYLQAIEEQV